MQRVVLDFDAVQAGEAHRLQHQQLVAKVTADFQNARVAGNRFQKAAIDCATRDAIVALIEFVNLRRSKSVPVGILAAKIAAPGANLLGIGSGLVATKVSFICYFLKCAATLLTA